MCSTLCNRGESILLRSYVAPKDAKPVSSGAKKLSDEGELEGISIGLAARATSAAPTYLPQVKWKSLIFWDGGLLNNNPIDQVWASRYDLVGPHDLAPTVSVVLSLGTSWSTPKPAKNYSFIGTVNRITSFATNTEAKHRDFQRYLNRIRDRIDENANTQYFRFNTPTGSDVIYLDDYLKMGELKTYTEKYLSTPEVQEQVKACAELLVDNE